ncbi:MAG: hypothetical protein KU37_04665 [Sulfuricurvum sp. PC08-66]|nr:MAG: hypothetical protein KU37_04665 [Sulfuricurvum sp. PC08-66]
MKKIVIFLLFASALLADGLHIGSVQTLLDEAHKNVKEIDGATLQKMLDKEESFFLVDLRGNEQLARGEIYHIDSFKIDRGYLEFEIERKIPDKNATVVLYCCSGTRSLLSAYSLTKMGYKNVRSLKGGLRDWVENGHALDTAYGEMILKK